MTNVGHSTVEDKFLQYWIGSSRSVQSAIRGSFEKLLLVRSALELGSPTNRLESNRVEVPPETAQLVRQVARWLRDTKEKTSFSEAWKDVPASRPRKRSRSCGEIGGFTVNQAIILVTSDAGTTAITRN